MNVAAWLRGLGLERYTQAFADHDIDADTLYQLSGADLAEIGVKSVGHRRMLLEAIAALDEAKPLQAAVPATPAPAEAEAEHRQLTVLYCAMGGSGAQTSGVQSEEMREVIRRFHQTCTRTVADFDGYMANFFGDCVLAYFGWPRAHEDDAERAVRAGLALARCMVMVHRGSGPGEALVLRVGIATGAVVVGELVKEGPAQEQSAVGLTPNLGARILSLAAPGQVAIDELTRRLLAPSFTVQPLGRHALKGIAEPVAAYLVSGERPAESRFDARKGHDLPPMVGRDQELALLTERWAQAQAGEGQAVLLVGEAGIGKSRLARALLDACAAEPCERFLWQCSPYHTGSALWPVIQALSRGAGLLATDSTDMALDKLEALTGHDKEVTALYASLLGLDGSQRYGPFEITPQMLRERTLEVLAERLLDIANERRLLLVIEDTQWIDPTTLELIERALEKIDSTRMLVLITSRPDKPPKLAAIPSITHLSLNRLSRANVEGIVARLGGNRLQVQTQATIVAQSDGVPLFVEELTKAVLETGEAAIPASLHGSLMARLDRIGEAKEVAQIAACIGREFDLALLRAVAEQPTAVDAALDKLVAAELVFRRGDRADSRFIFKHALVQEAANESLLRGKRRSIHARILQVLEAERAQTPPEILAHHAEGAHQAEKALACWRRAGDASLAKSAYVEATNCYVSAIRLVEAQPQGSDRKTQELELQLRLASTYVPAQGSGAEATRTAFQRAEELLDDDPRKHLQVHFGLWAWSAMAGRLGEALARTTHVLSAARADGRDEAKLLAHTIVAISHLLRGELGPARDHFERALAFHDPTRPAQLVAEIGYDPGALAHCFFGWALCIQGFAEQGKDMLDRAQGIACVLPQVIARVNTRLICALSGACARDVAAARTNAEALAELATRHRLAKSSSYASNLLGWVAMESGRPAEAVVRHEQAIARRTGMARVYDVFFSSWWATALAATGRHEKALHMIEQGIHESEEMAQGWCDAELWRVRGELLLGSPQHDEAQASRCFKRALAIARQRGAKLWELRAAVSLARLWARQGEVARAVDLLTPIYDWFTEGFDAIDLVEARALLSTLRQQLS